MKNILITGADGYVGKKLALNLLKSSDANLTLWMRADSEEEKQSKTQKMDDSISEYKSRVVYSFGNLSQENPFQEIDNTSITDIVHSAAVIRFNVEEDLAKDINLQGTLKTLEFAKKCESLNKFTYVSTVYSSGPTTGLINEEEFSLDKNFVNFYESSKCQSEKEVEQSGVNYKIARLSTVIADSEDGEIIQYNVFHNTLRLLYNGLISLLPGDANTPLYFITGDFAALAMTDIVLNETDRKYFHICHTEDESATLNDLMNWVFETFNEYDAFKQKRVMKPLFADEKTFNTMADAMKSFSQGILADALGSITPFAKQLYISKSFTNENLQNVMQDKYQAPDPERLIKNATKYLIDNKWGRK
jgi:thioester reductase-like protein